VVRSVRALAGRYYYEATLLGPGGSTAKSTKVVKGVRVGWAQAGGSPTELMGEGTDSVGIDGGRRRLYSNARPAREALEAAAKAKAEGAGGGGGQPADSKLPRPEEASKVAPRAPEPLPAPPAPTPSEGGSPPAPPPDQAEPQAAPPPVPPGAVARKESFDWEGVGGLFVEKEEEVEDDGPDGGRDFGAGGEPWRVGDVVGVMIDLDERSFSIHVNGVVQVRCCLHDSTSYKRQF
jgi:hypothetical protein